MVNKIIFLTLALFFFTLPLFAQQYAITTDGREVILYDDFTWEYVEDDSGLDIARINQELKNLLAVDIHESPDVFMDFGIPLDPKIPYEARYKGAIIGFHQASQKMDAEDFYDKLDRVFGPNIANKIMIIIENWELWEEFCL